MRHRASYEESIKRGDSLAWQGRWEESVHFFQKAVSQEPEALLPRCSLGVVLTHLGRFDEALQEYRQVLTANPRDILALAMAADSYARLGRMEECAETYLRLGDTYIEQRNHLRATAVWRKLVSLVPENPAARARLAEALEKQGDFEDAAEQYAFLALDAGKNDYGEQLALKALALDPNNGNARWLIDSLGQGDSAELHHDDEPSMGPADRKAGSETLLFDEKGRDESIPQTEVEKTLERSFGGSQIPYGGAPVDSGASSVVVPLEEVDESCEDGLRKSLAASEDFMSKGLYFAAIDECFWSISLAPTHLTMHVRVGEILVARGRVSEAVDKYSCLASMFFARGDVSDALGMHERIVQLCPQDYEQRENLIRLLARSGRDVEAMEQQLAMAVKRSEDRQFDRAEADFKEAIRMSPGDIRPHLSLAEMLAGTGRIGEAVREYEAVASLDPNNIGAILALSIDKRLSGEYEESRNWAFRLIQLIENSPSDPGLVVEKYLAAAEQHPDIPDFAAWAGIALFVWGKRAEAIPFLERAMKGAFDPEPVRTSLCRCYLAQGMHLKALTLLNRIPASTAVQVRDACFREADRLGAAGSWVDAIDLLRALKQADSREDSIYMKLAEMYYRQGDISSALQEFDVIGQLYVASGQPRRAVVIFRLLKQIAPNTTLAYQRLGDLFVVEGKRNEAVAEYKALANLLLRQGETSKAIISLRRVVELDPEEVDGLLMLGEALFHEVHYADAARVFSRLLEFDPANAIAQSRLAVIRAITGR